MHRYPEGTVTTAEVLITSRWRDAISSSNTNSYPEIWQALSKAAAVALEEGLAPESKALWLLADATSMMLKPKSVNEPFAPMLIFGERRSAVTADFSQEDIELFTKVARDIDHHLIRARLCDLVWLCARPRNADFAVLAIDAYSAIPLAAETWASGARDCWERAIALCYQLRAGAGPRLEGIEISLLDTFNSAIASDGFFALSMARLLFENNLGRGQARETADILATKGSELALGASYNEARRYLEAAAQWYGRLENSELHADMICAVADAWTKEGATRANGSQPSNMIATSFYENAIQTLRKVPRNLRPSRSVDDRLAELYKLLEGAGKASLGEMGIVSSGPIDISEIVKAAQASVRGKDLVNALGALANIHTGARISKLKEFAEKMLRENPMQALFASTHMSKDGRVIAKRPGAGFDSSNSKEYQLTLWAEMVKYYVMEIGLIAQSQLLPALDALSLDHRILEADLEYIAHNSPIVPDDRVTLFAKGLFAGFEHDLVSALHILVPQVEHLVRWHLKAAGVKTTTLSLDGVENENGLSTLVDLPEVIAIFGEDLAFEFKALFCDAFGPNLRNELAHGLLDAPSCQTPQTFYAWWFVLRMTFNNFWNAVRKSQVDILPEEILPDESSFNNT